MEKGTAQLSAHRCPSWYNSTSHRPFLARSNVKPPRPVTNIDSHVVEVLEAHHGGVAGEGIVRGIYRRARVERYRHLKSLAIGISLIGVHKGVTKTFGGTKG